MPTVVYSRLLYAVLGKTQLSRGDPVHEVRTLKQQTGGPIDVEAPLSPRSSLHSDSSTSTSSSVPLSSEVINDSLRATPRSPYIYWRRARSSSWSSISDTNGARTEGRCRAGTQSVTVWRPARRPCQEFAIAASLRAIWAAAKSAPARGASSFSWPKSKRLSGTTSSRPWRANASTTSERLNRCCEPQPVSATARP
jgi:hypothetical protein